MNCPDIGHNNFKVLPPDPHGLDRDNDGIGCEDPTANNNNNIRNRNNTDSIRQDCLPNQRMENGICIPAGDTEEGINPGLQIEYNEPQPIGPEPIPADPEQKEQDGETEAEQDVEEPAAQDTEIEEPDSESEENETEEEQTSDENADADNESEVS